MQIKSEQAEAFFEIPKAEEVKPKSIKVKAKGLIEGKK